MSAERDFLIDLVRINSILRVTAFNNHRVSTFDLTRQTGLSVNRVEDVLCLALTTDFRDYQQEILTSLIDFTDAASEVFDVKDARFIRNKYPPLRVLAALTGMPYDRLNHLHKRDRELLERTVERAFANKVSHWVESNLANAAVIKPGQWPEAKETMVAHTPNLNPGTQHVQQPDNSRGEGLTDAMVQQHLSQRFNIHADDIAVIGRM